MKMAMGYCGSTGLHVAEVETWRMDDFNYVDRFIPNNLKSELSYLSPLTPLLYFFHLNLFKKI